MDPTLIPDFISPELEAALVQEIDQNDWFIVPKSTRRVQHYGYRYDYTSGSTNQPAPPFPPLLQHLANTIAQMGYMVQPQQAIINEYDKTQGIGAHYDRLEYGPIITSVSLLEDTNMNFAGRPNTSYAGQKQEVLLSRRSLLVMSGPYRQQFTHAIPKRSTVTYPDDKRVAKKADYRRISVTFRTLA